MDFRRHFLFLFVLLVCLDIVSNTDLSSAQDVSDVDKRDTGKATSQTSGSTTTAPAVKPKETSDNDSCVNGSGSGCKKPDTGFFGSFSENKDMLLRTLYVLIGVTSVVILYFVFRAWRWVMWTINQNLIDKVYN